MASRRLFVLISYRIRIKKIEAHTNKMYLTGLLEQPLKDDIKMYLRY